MSDKAKKIIEILELKPHTVEGGFFRETYRSDEVIAHPDLPQRYQGSRAFSTAIYYMLTPETFSSLHKLSSDEIFHFYLGDPVEMLQLSEDGTGKIIKLGNDIEKGYRLQEVVPKNTWQGARLIEGGEFALFGVTVAPGFEFQDFVAADRNSLLNKYPAFSDMINKLTLQ